MPIFLPLSDDEKAMAVAFAEKVNAISDPIERQMVIRAVHQAVFKDVSPEDAAANRKRAFRSPHN